MEQESARLTGVGIRLKRGAELALASQGKGVASEAQEEGRAKRAH